MVTHEEIAKVAHELYEKSGRVHGRDVENWLEAERIITSRTGKAREMGNGGESREAGKRSAAGERGRMSAAPEETVAAEKASSRKRTVTRTTAKAEPGTKKSAAKRTSRAKKAE